MASDDKYLELLTNISMKVGNIESDVHSLKGDMKEFRKETKEELKDMSQRVDNLHGFKNRILGVASVVGAAAAFVMSVIVAYVTKKI